MKRVALITGALTGIGRATAIAFAREGYQVIVSGRREKEGIALAKELNATGATAEFVGATQGVRVNAIAPGPVDTGMLTRFTGTDDRKAALISGVPMKRMGLPEEVAQAIVFLGSDKSPFLTGQIIAVDGGKLA